MNLAAVHDEVSAALAALAPLFTAGMKLTFVARHPDHAERYVIVGDETDYADLAKWLMKAQGGKDAHEKGCNR